MTAWYEQVPNETPLTQGDIVSCCPVLVWTKPDDITIDGEKNLVAQTSVEEHDVIVMSQACDLEQDNLTEVILCPVHLLSEWRPAWEAARKAKDQKTNTDAWKNYCKRVKTGTQWNLSMLNANTEPATEHRIVDFYRVYSTPRTLIEKLLADRGGTRSRLAAPYREHLSQAFARFFMRVGLPIDIDGF